MTVERDAATGDVLRMGTPDAPDRYASAITHLPSGPVTHLRYGNGLKLGQMFNKRYEPSGAPLVSASGVLVDEGIVRIVYAPPTDSGQSNCHPNM